MKVDKSTKVGKGAKEGRSPKAKEGNQQKLADHLK